MSLNVNWDVDEYKTEHECDEHWQLRRSFMLAHKDKFPEDRLVCLAQVFTNTEFLGCRYPAETMRLVASLAQGVADEYREKQKGRLQRTFVQASDAAGAKAKGLKRPLQEEGPSEATVSSQQEKKLPRFDPRSVITVDARLQNRFTSKSQGDSSTVAKVTYGPSVCATSRAQNSANGSLRVDSSRYGGVKTYHIDQAAAGRPPQSTGPEVGGPYGKLVIIEPANQAVGAMHTLQKSTAMCQVPMRVVYGQHVSSEV